MSKQLSNTTINNKLNLLLTNTADMALKRRAKVIVEMLNIQPGDKILGKIVELENEDGYVELSLKEASRQRVWDQRAIRPA